MSGRSDGLREPRFISASEVSKYIFCNVSWYLDRVGAPRNKGTGQRMQRGIQSHSTLKRRYNASRVATLAIVILMLMVSGYLFFSLY